MVSGIGGSVGNSDGLAAGVLVGVFSDVVDGSVLGASIFQLTLLLLGDAIAGLEAEIEIESGITGPGQQRIHNDVIYMC